MVAGYIKAICEFNWEIVVNGELLCLSEKGYQIFFIRYMSEEN